MNSKHYPFLILQDITLQLLSPYTLQKVVKTVLYTSEDGAVAINVIIDSENDTIWTTQKTTAELYGKNIKTVSKHLNNIFESEELVKSEVTFNPNDSTNSGNVIIHVIQLCRCFVSLFGSDVLTP